MPDTLVWIIGAAIVVAVVSVALKKRRGPKIPDALRPGQSLPDFAATDEQGNPVQSARLVGVPTVMLFVRGNWCPFCSRQVESLTRHYKDIVELGARLILVTPKPLETTRRVAAFFEVEFEFWLDDQLDAARQMGLVMRAGVPDDHRREYGTDTVWPTALVVDAAGIIRFARLSRFIVDRPNPKALLKELKKL